MASPLSPNPKPLNPRATPYTKGGMIQYLHTAPAYPLSAKLFMASKVLLPHEIYEPQLLPQEPNMTTGLNSFHRYVCDLNIFPWGYQEAAAFHGLGRLPGHTYLVPLFPVYTEHQPEVENVYTSSLAATIGTFHPNTECQDELHLGKEKDEFGRVNKSKVLFGCKDRRLGHASGIRFSAPRFRAKRREGENSCVNQRFSGLPKSSNDNEGGAGDNVLNREGGDKLDRKNAAGGHSDDREVILNGKTSLMIRNIPNHLQRYNLLGILDDHCREQNKQARLHSDPVMSEYDFLYLPMDFRRRANLGYAFVNFTNAVAASRFSKVFDKYDWNDKRKKKICEISCAVLQGKNALSNQFKDSIFPCHTDEYLPVILAPPRNGWNKSRSILVGKRAKTPASSSRAHVNQNSKSVAKQGEGLSESMTSPCL